MSPEAVDLQVLGASALSAVRARAQSALAAWASGWLRQPSVVDTTAVRGEIAVHELGGPFDRFDGPWGAAWIRRLPADQTLLGRAVLGAGLVDAKGAPIDDWLADALRHARDSRNEALCQALLGGIDRKVEQVLPAFLRSFGSGAVEITCEGIGLTAIVDRGVLRHVPPNEARASVRTPRTPLDQALPDTGLKLTVSLGTVDLEVAKLLDLRRGDVLRLPTRIDQGLPVHCEQRPVAKGLLGTRDGRRAVQLVTHPVNP